MVLDIGNLVARLHQDTGDGDFDTHHYAFLVSEDEFDPIFDRIGVGRTVVRRPAPHPAERDQPPLGRPRRLLRRPRRPQPGSHHPVRHRGCRLDEGGEHRDRQLVTGRHESTNSTRFTDRTCRRHAGTPPMRSGASTTPSAARKVSARPGADGRSRVTVYRRPSICSSSVPNGGARRWSSSAASAVGSSMRITVFASRCEK